MSKEYYDPGMYGTDNYWKYPYGKLIYVDSVRNFCQEKKAYWILDLIASYRFEISFLVITIDVEDGTAMFKAKEDDGMPDVVAQFIEYTDLDVSVKFFLEDGVLIFPSDH